MFIIYNGKDERDPHNFLLSDPFYKNGLVKSWDIKELDLIHSERDDELMLREKFRWEEKHYLWYLVFNINEAGSLN